MGPPHGPKAGPKVGKGNWKAGAGAWAGADVAGVDDRLLDCEPLGRGRELEVHGPPYSESCGQKDGRLNGLRFEIFESGADRVPAAGVRGGFARQRLSSLRNLDLAKPGP